MSAITACATVPLYAQSRKALTGPTIGAGPKIGRGGSYTFTTYSFGVGSLQTGTSGTTGVLSSKINSGANFSIARPGGGGGARGVIGSSPTLAAPREGIRSGGSVPKAVANIGGEAPIKAPSRFSAASGANLLLATNSENPLQNAQGDEPITTLVPDEPSTYQKYLMAGEQRFRAGNYTKAFYEFQSANYIGRNDPESLLSMANAQFAMEHFSSATNYLKKALKYFPELPILPLRLRDFYNSPDDYAACINALLEYLKDNPDDSDALLLLAYYRWFNEEYASAKTLLEQAEQCGPSQDTFEAIEIFRRGMIASGKISFEEETPASQPEEGKTKPDEKVPTPKNEDIKPIEAS